MKTLTCAIIDDEPLAAQLLESYVAKTPFLTLRGSYGSAVEASGEILAEPVDLVFCDIQMPDLDGLAFARLITPPTRLVLTTAFSQYAIEGYKVNAADYLLKPIAYPDFLAAAEKVRREMSERNGESSPAKSEPTSEGDTAAAASSAQQPADEAFFVKADYKFVRILPQEVRYVEGLKDYVKIYTQAPRPILSHMAMHAIEAHLAGYDFLRVHRSYIVNMQRIEGYDRGQILLPDRTIPVGDSYREAVLAYINGRMIKGR